MTAAHRPTPAVAIAHDYLTQRGGAERVVLSLTRAFPDAEVHTALHDPAGTFPELADVTVRTAPIDRIGLLRRHHRLALPVLAPTWSTTTIDAEVVVCNTSGWAHGVRTTGAKVVMCHAPARWLYQTDAYTAESSAATKAMLAVLGPPLRRWDQRAARSADLYLANSSRARQLVRDAYGIDADIVHPPHSIDVDGERTPVPGLDPGFFLCVSRLLPYKHVDVAVAAFAALPAERLVVVGEGPDDARLRAMAGPNVTFLGRVSDTELRWLYAEAEALVALGVEDFGLTPVEAAVFGTPSIVVPFGGYLDTVADAVNGVHLTGRTPDALVTAVDRLRSLTLDEATVTASAEPFSEAVFTERIRGHVDALASATRP
ncbi:MAG: glycosyltransferase [Acidimicrobiales bacterium]|nr:glycosyltransferase [Acidimicrobiales bacterium]